MTNQTSNCCNASMITISSVEGTGYFECSECHKPCDMRNPFNSSKPQPTEQPPSPSVFKEIPVKGLSQEKHSTGSPQPWEEALLKIVSPDNLHSNKLFGDFEELKEFIKQIEKDAVMDVIAAGSFSDEEMEFFEHKYKFDITEEVHKMLEGKL